jgi:hypothetical protein
MTCHDRVDQPTDDRVARAKILRRQRLELCASEAPGQRIGCRATEPAPQTDSASDITRREIERLAKQGPNARAMAVLVVVDAAMLLARGLLANYAATRRFTSARSARMSKGFSITGFGTPLKKSLACCVNAPPVMNTKRSKIAG